MAIDVAHLVERLAAVGTLVATQIDVIAHVVFHVTQAGRCEGAHFATQQLFVAARLLVELDHLRVQGSELLLKLQQSQLFQVVLF